MKIGIDASRYGGAEATGVEWYSYHLLNELIPLMGREHTSKVFLFSPKEIKFATDLPFNVKKRVIPAKRFWTILRLSYELLTHPVDALFVPSHTLPWIIPKKSVITIHDVAFRYFKHCYSFWQYWQLEISTKRAVKKSWKIIVPSEATKKDLIKFYDCPKNKITVIAHGAPEYPKILQFSSLEKEKIMKRFNLKDDDLFVFYVGRLESKKNLVRLIEGFARFLKEFPDWKLILAGKNGVGYEDILEAVALLGLNKNVVMPGYITEREKLFLMSACRIVAFPSLYEGFGLPVLEGFAMRRPVLTSNVSSMPEVAGDAAFLVNPEKVEEIGVGLKRLASDGFFVNQLINKGEKQVERFEWEKAARQTYDVLFG